MINTAGATVTEFTASGTLISAANNTKGVYLEFVDVMAQGSGATVSFEVDGVPFLRRVGGNDTRPDGRIEGMVIEPDKAIVVTIGSTGFCTVVWRDLSA